MFFRMFGPNAAKCFSSLAIGGIDIASKYRQPMPQTTTLVAPRSNRILLPLSPNMTSLGRRWRKFFVEAEKKDRIIELMSRPAERRSAVA